MEPQKIAHPRTSSFAQPARGTHDVPSASGASNASGAHGAYRRYIRRKHLVLAVTALCVLVLLFASLLQGSSDLSAGRVLAALFGAGDAQETAVVWGLRMPHVLAACIGGIALALSGCAFQGVLGNPLASPSTIGVAQGAAFGASIAIIVFGSGTTAALEGLALSGSAATALFAFCGALVSTLVILGLSRFRDLSPESVVLAGVALSAFFSGLTALIQYFADDTQVAAVVFWTFGSLRRVGFAQLGIMAGVTVLSGVFFHCNRWNYNAMESGEGSAHGLGVAVARVRLANMLVATVSASTIIAFCGTINFIGLVAPHVMRRLVGSDYRYLLPASALAGMALLLASDLIASSVVPSVILPIGAITSLVGAPVFLYLLVKGMHR